MVRIYSQTKAISACSAQEKDDFFRLLGHDFLGVTREDFERDFGEKEAVMILRTEDEHGEIVGWSTLKILPLALPAPFNEVVMGVFSGDTVVLPQYRTSFGIGKELVNYFLDAYARFPDHKVYYTLTSKGWRTYKIMPFYFKDYAPRPDQPTTPFDQMVIDTFGRTKYPDNFDLATGLVSFGSQRVRPGGVDAAPEHPDRYAQYFLERNPDYLAGHELVCIGRITLDNFTGAARRLAGLEG